MMFNVYYTLAERMTSLEKRSFCGNMQASRGEKFLFFMKTAFKGRNRKKCEVADRKEDIKLHKSDFYYTFFIVIVNLWIMSDEGIVFRLCLCNKESVKWISMPMVLGFGGIEP